MIGYESAQSKYSKFWGKHLQLMQLQHMTHKPVQRKIFSCAFWTAGNNFFVTTLPFFNIFFHFTEALPLKCYLQKLIKNTEVWKIN